MYNMLYNLASPTDRNFFKMWLPTKLRVIGTSLPRDCCVVGIMLPVCFCCVSVCFCMLHVFCVPPGDRAPCMRLHAPTSQKIKCTEREARWMSDAGRHASRVGCVLDEDPEDGKRTVDARKLGVNARERSTQQPLCWSPTSCALLWNSRGFPLSTFTARNRMKRIKEIRYINSYRKRKVLRLEVLKLENLTQSDVFK